MNLPDTVRTVRWMVRDTFRQSVSTKLFYVMLALVAVATLLCASVRVTGDVAPTTYDWEVPALLPKSEAERLGMDKVKNDGARVISGEVSFGFGATKVPLGRTREDAVHFLQTWLAGWFADTAGVLLALLWTAGFLPTFLEPQSATVLLAKPGPRWSILLGKYLGVVGFVAFQAALFVGGTWAALGFATGVWSSAYWLAVPLLVLNFAVFYSVSVFLSVWTRSTVASAFGTLIFWMLCWLVDYSHLRMLAQPGGPLTPLAQGLMDAGYWVLPKPLDLSGIFFDAMNAETVAAKPVELKVAESGGHLHPEASVASSLAFAAGVLGLSVFEFKMTDY